MMDDGRVHPAAKQTTWQPGLHEQERTGRRALAMPREQTMRKSIRSHVALVAILSVAGVVSFAQTGEATYKSKCAMCHGATGMADTGAGKSMKIKPVNDPEVKKMSRDDLIALTTNGKGKMPAFKGKLTDDQIKGAVDQYISLGK